MIRTALSKRNSTGDHISPEGLTAELTVIAERYLSNDAVMAGLIAKHGRCQLPDSRRDFFEILARSIISQQLSVKAADTIEARVRGVICGALTPKCVLDTTIDSLRSAGLSRAKALYIKGVAERLLDKRLAPVEFHCVRDQEVIAELVKVPGIGRWTAEMFLIFGLKRPDVLAINDAGLRRAALLLYGQEIEHCSEAWRPYRSVASWYLWRHLDGP